MSLRESDIVARYGGEEFIVILPLTQVSTSYTLAERLRTIIENTQLVLPGESEIDILPIGVSVGVAGMTSECKDYQCLIKNADRALYQSKQNGRNQVRVA